MPDTYRRSVARIVSRATRRRSAKLSPCPEMPESYGWLRRSDLDQNEGEAWELPDGEIRLTRPALNRTRKGPGQTDR